MKEVGPNMRTWWEDEKNTYVTGPWRRGDNWQKIVGPVAATGSLLFEATDYAVAGALDNRLSPPSGIAGRTRRDIGQLLDNAVRLRPFRATTDAFRLVLNDLPMDGIDIIGGFHAERGSTAHNLHTEIARNRMRYGSTDTSYATAA